MTDQTLIAPTKPACAPTPGNAQWIGARHEQQDAFGFAGFDARGQAGPDGVLAVVADGMGGMTGGRAASQAAVRAFLATWTARPARQGVPDALYAAMQAANRAVHDLATATVGEGQTGTTLVAAAVCAGQLFWIATGDSRLYLYRAADGALTPCNEAHNFALNAWRAAPADGPAPDWIASDPDRDALISFLGLAEIPEIDHNVRALTLHPGDRLLLCSDGVDGVLCEEELISALAGDPQSAADRIIARLQGLGRPHQDNATVAILACPGGPVPTGTESTTVRIAAALPGARVNRRPRWVLPYAMAGLVFALVLGILVWFGWRGGEGSGPWSSAVEAFAAATGAGGPPDQSPATSDPATTDGAGPGPTPAAPAAAETTTQAPPDPNAKPHGEP